jgi:hypothetical protein
MRGKNKSNMAAINWRKLLKLIILRRILRRENYKERFWMRETPATKKGNMSNPIGLFQPRELTITRVHLHGRLKTFQLQSRVRE